MENEDEIRKTILLFGERAVQEYQDEKVQGLTPKRITNYLNMLAGYSSLLEEEMGSLEIARAKAWPALRLTNKSNVDAENEWNATEEGLRTFRVSRTLKAVDKIIAACKNTLRRMENEALNKY